MLRTIGAPPEVGTLRESVLTLLVMKLETIEHARFRALAQITLEKEKGVEAFEEYMKIAFPYLEATKKHERRSHIEKLQSEIHRGPIAVRALATPQLKSRMSASKASRIRPQSREEEQRLYKRIGRTI